mmetsp:Transcript_37691/g.69549  ORF Transcript_37691/g.69549 Transcript_37691/m.69549 type:complete len:110 (-) Transcript_37691:242-571(-)|eukprot:CAMPEP_0170173382 /NCGR_PEP_ID=MMETSP0040_2-20121228/6664_1 /TAXON_ID=641309 /ORGANISM="Lotharella oceanica, Strain CCMP622" /LENGTH=109 /DNA_ID=CAMNT_0010414539 /DNA_START=46 /DNA_END=375 /DNA_ORIENTATION=-
MSLDNIVFNNDTDAFGAEDNTAPSSVVHIRNQQRNGRKSLTTISGLADDLDLKKILKYIRKMYQTNGTVKNDKEHGDVIQVQGDLRKEIAQFLTEYKVCDKDEIKLHGF